MLTRTGCSILLGPVRAPEVPNDIAKTSRMLMFFIIRLDRAKRNVQPGRGWLALSASGKVIYSLVVTEILPPVTVEQSGPRTMGE
jgi:hypothetical protein